MRVDECPFCDPSTLAEAIYQNKHMYVVHNLTKYDLWELHEVTDHLMIIPKRHVESLQELSEKERLAIMETASEYEYKGYSIYARGVGSSARSVAHQHTHLIKTTGKKPLVSIYLRRPYLLLRK
jgi:diadenosine tetraphosphate (Ap4A) HIT family hydrolase